MAKAKITVIEKSVGTTYAYFGFGRGDADSGNWQWRQYQVSRVSKASASRFERALSEQAKRVEEQTNRARHAQKMAFDKIVLETSATGRLT